MYAIRSYYVNIDILLEQVLTVRKDAGLDFDVLFVDSASVDGTGEKVLAWRDKAPVDLLQQGKRSGLASAVIDGARMSKSDIVLVMDRITSYNVCYTKLLRLDQRNSRQR